LYRHTYDRRLLDLAVRIVQVVPGYQASDHSHSYLSTLRGLWLLFEEAGDEGYLRRVLADMKIIEERHMLPSGGIHERFTTRNRDEACSTVDWWYLCNVVASVRRQQPVH